MAHILRRWALTITAGAALSGCVGFSTGVEGTAASLDANPNCPVLSPSSDPGPYFVTVQVPLPDGVKVLDNHVNVILPAGYCTSGEHYPVLYLLHGAGDTYKAWESNTDLKQFVTDNSAAFPYIFVMPDGGANAEAGWYSDWLNGEWQYETYDTNVLPAYINAEYATVPNDIGIAGLSMGGFGSMSFAARHPGMYKVAGSFSGAVDTLYGAPVSGLVFNLLSPYEGTPNQGVWGSQTTEEPVWAAHNPTSLAGDLAGTTLLIASGTGTPGGPEGDALNPAGTFDPGGYVLENGIYQMNLAFVDALHDAGVPYTSHFYLGGYHGWPYWQADLHWAMPYIAQVLGHPVP